MLQIFKRLRHQNVYSETFFVKDKWAEWSQCHSNLIPSNIISGVPKTPVLDKIDWEKIYQEEVAMRTMIAK